MHSVQLFGRFLLAEQMRQGDRSVPVILWTTEVRRSVVAGLRLWRAGFSVHRYWMGGDVLRVQATQGWRRRAVHAVLRHCYASHAVSSAWLGEELAEVGITSTPLPLNPACCE